MLERGCLYGGHAFYAIDAGSEGRICALSPLSAAAQMGRELLDTGENITRV